MDILTVDNPKNFGGFGLKEGVNTLIAPIYMFKLCEHVRRDGEDLACPSVRISHQWSDVDLSAKWDTGSCVKKA